jgi:hypothetical protein
MRSRSVPMTFVVAGMAATILLSPQSTNAKGKDKAILSPIILSAKTAQVVIDPDAGVSPEDPLANQTARKDVETALANWGRFQTNLVGQPSDLIIVIRRGQDRLTRTTIHDPRQNDQAGAINPLDNGIQIGARQGQPTDPATGRPTTGGETASPQLEVGGSDDTFVVYNGQLDHPLETPALWRYDIRDGLHPHSVPAVGVFRKAITDAEKAAAKKP